MKIFYSWFVSLVSVLMSTDSSGRKKKEYQAQHVLPKPALTLHQVSIRQIDHQNQVLAHQHPYSHT